MPKSSRAPLLAPALAQARFVPRLSRFLPMITVVALLAALSGCQSRTPAQPASVSVVPPASLSAGMESEFVAPLPAPRAALPVHVDPADPAACCLRANLWYRIRAGFKFDLTLDNDRIRAQRNWYIRNQAYLDRVIARGSRYMHHIVEETEARDMPMELALLPVVESAFDPFAYSVADAAGPWQFIPSTGRAYGLRQDWWYDGRRDILLSTDAALGYLERLAARFDGDYYKALASYNAGSGTIGRAITKNLRAGLRTDYWSLKVPQETAAYVPKLIALAQIVQNPEKYGVRLNPIADEPRFVEVELPGQVDLARAAELANMPLAELYLYNPAHSRWLTDPQGPHRLLIPIELAEEFRNALATAVPDELVFAVAHTVGDDDTLASIANRYAVPAESIREFNALQGDVISAGATLMIPQPRLMVAASDMTYETRIVALNRPGKGKRGSSAATVSQSKRHVVTRGETLSSIARKYKVSAGDIARWNKIKIRKPLLIGQTLTIQGGGAPSVVARSSATRTNSGIGDRRVSHKVKPGETLSSLARKFKVSVHDIARWNDFSPQRQLRIGERVKVYVD